MPDSGGEHCDDLADALALVEAVREGRTGDMAVLLKNMNAYGVAVVLAKMFAVITEDQGVSPAGFRAWAERAVKRDLPMRAS